MHGAQAGEKVRHNVFRYSQATNIPPSHICDQYIERYYMPALEEYFPQGLEEMKGIAEGARVSLADVVLLNARYDLARVRAAADSQIEFVGECTSMALIVDELSATHDSKSILVAQNWDSGSWLYLEDSIIVLQIADNEADDVITARSIICLTEAGQLCRSGMSSLGLGLCANSLWSSEDASPHLAVSEATAKPYLPFSLARRMFLECTNFAAGLKAVCTVPRHVSGNIVLGSRAGLAINLELTPSCYLPSTPRLCRTASDSAITKLVTHSNHFTSNALFIAPGIRDMYPGGSSLFRHTQLADRLERRICTGETVTVEGVKSAFADHAGFPRSLCEHREKKDTYGATNSDTMTVACVIYDLKKLEMHVCKGTPCDGVWTTYHLHRTGSKSEL